MLQALRGGAKSPIMKVFLVFLAGGFALWGVGDMTTGLIGGSDKAISAGDQSLSPREVAMEFDRARRSYLPNATVGEALQSGLLSEVTGALARDVVFGAEAQKLGIAVTRDMQRYAVANEPSFKDELGDFSQSRFISILANAGMSEEEYLNQIETTLRRAQIVDAIAAGATLPGSVARTMTAHELERRTAKLVTVTVNTDAVAEPDDSTLSSWFDEVKSRYDAPALRSARIGSIDPQMFLDEIEISDEAIRTAYQDRIDEFTTPEQRRVRQMVFDDAAVAGMAFERVSGGEEFAAVAQDLLGWSELDTQLGLVTRSDLDEALAEQVFATAAGGIAGPVESAFGVHVLAIDEVIAGGEASLDDVRDAIRQTLQSESAIDLIFEKANILEDLVASGATIDEAIAKVGGTAATLTDIDRRGNDIDGVPYAGEGAGLAEDSLVVEAVWSGDIGTPGVIQEGADDMFFIVEVTGETDPRGRDLAEVRNRAITDWKLVEAIKAARAEAEAVGAEALDSADATDAFRRTGTGLDHEAARLIATAAFGQKIGETRVVETGSEAIAVRTETVIPAEAEELADTAKLLADFTSGSIQRDILNTLASDLSQTHDLQVRLGGVQQLLMGGQ
ncbi:MAG: SurA N-terminal domain-containing protein [Pseudomonadota bacterium]|nr:SurA N-terminal domain-containing protein [Pseudomonadota bacterium]MEC8270641.1 SurA N-terminal domain-containing protein [Pseudomonadota bacterium]